MTLDQLKRSITTQLDEPLGHREAAAVARVLLEDVLGITPTVLAIRGDRDVEPETAARIDAMTARIAGGEPVQYVIGKAQFMGLSLRVTPATLIPRPETAGLVDMITDDAGSRRDLRVLDIGTGSGCISIALARALTFAVIDAIDISADALEVARYNARHAGCDINFKQCDILTATPPPTPVYDLIVSNPPYIARHESAAMSPTVTRHEPHTALFVPDDDPLRFYTAIARYGRGGLKDGGRLYLEINPEYSDRLADNLAADGYSDIVISRDYTGRKRYCRATIRR